MEPVEYRALGWGEEDDVSGMLGRLNELGAEGWEVCGAVRARTGKEVIGMVEPAIHHGQFLLLKRRKAA
ncbi:MAG: hypothetical protein ACLQDY_13235 [Streptosporangiaceae bacterium]